MIDLTGLTEYVEEQRLPLIRKSIFAAPSTKYFNIQTGVKHSAALNILDTEVVFGDGATCGWDASGDDAFSQRILEVGNFKVNKSYCDKAMLKYWNGYGVKVAAGQAVLPFEEDFVGGVLDAIRVKLENIIWKGVKGTDGADGLLTILDAASASTIQPSLSTGTTIYDKVKAVYMAIPAGIENASIFLGLDKFKELVQEMVAKNLYHYMPEQDMSYEITLPGTMTKVRGVYGLNNTKAIVAADSEKNIYFGTDMEGDEERFDLWYSKDNQEFRLAINFNAGVQVARPDEVVIAKWTND